MVWVEYKQQEGKMKKKFSVRQEGQVASLGREGIYIRYTIQSKFIIANILSLEQKVLVATSFYATNKAVIYILDFILILLFKTIYNR